MAEAYKEAAIRHWRDASLLERENRRPNANQLFGFAAECAIKTALRELPGFAPSGQLSSYYRVHINVLWERVAIQGLHHRFPGLVALLKSGNHFDDWSIDHRYAEEGVVPEQAFERHRIMATRLLGSVGIHGSRDGC